MIQLTPRRGTPMPDLLERLGSRGPFGDHHPVKVETYAEEGELIVRCELPGMNPERDIHLTVEGTVLKISAKRGREEHGYHHTEFQYGAFTRSLTLPAGADADQIKADYDAGILTIRIPLRESGAGKEIPVARRGR
ncbi:hypothetical protein GCM10027271_30810 [Saccharopolyspora gloriosae]|uniref:HSP20 family molecular chaperone IbpA n=1 Tax=Saccharopolyspora gloriosae TaxID=455344 RepID=A0A840NDL9_9PSEU|nr:Hsp20/alpha crystallin family protein [Saccharopolyspora gloriosae]MBB5070020.1 HSP20 family molecular chaperone IbpA [Saccharopolyspora gloriosae]